MNKTTSDHSYFSNESISIGHKLIPYSCRISLGKETAIILFLPFLRNFSCDDVLLYC